jgi:hypothetical protein
VTDIGTSGIGTTFGGSPSLFVLALAAAAIFALAGAYSLRRRDTRA